MPLSLCHDAVKSIPVPGRPKPFLYRNGIVDRAGKSIIQILLWGDQMIAGDIQLSGFAIAVLLRLATFACEIVDVRANM